VGNETFLYPATSFRTCPLEGMALVARLEGLFPHLLYLVDWL
jgi:hypothetical protein